VTAAAPGPPRIAAAGPIDQPGTEEARWRGWARLPQLPAVDPAGWPSVLVLAAHPDDEVLGVGGTLALAAAAGARLRLVAVTDGEASHPGAADPAALARRRTAERSAALRRLGVPTAEVVRLRLPDTAVAAHEAGLTARLGELAGGYRVCLAPWDEDGHADHEAVGRAARRAGLAVLYYPVWMWHWARPGDPRVPWPRAARVALPPALAERKRAAISCFTSQLEDRAGAAGPVLSSRTVAHFTRDHEVLLRGR
jgi:LmbE family N-acetylglucosaminyl deacetylase